MNRNLKIIIGTVAIMLTIAVMGQVQGDLTLAATRDRVTPTPISSGGSSGTGVPSNGDSSTGNNGTSNSGSESNGNAVGTSVTGVPGTGVPGTGATAPAGPTSAGQPGTGESVTKVSNSTAVIAPTQVKPTVAPTKTPVIKIVIGGTSSAGAPGATGVPGRRS